VEDKLDTCDGSERERQEYEFNKATFRKYD